MLIHTNTINKRNTTFIKILPPLRFGITIPFSQTKSDVTSLSGYIYIYIYMFVIRFNNINNIIIMPYNIIL